ncbi:flagellar basal body P-ring formation chaperone FlgA [Halanaerobacter jeridensis]|uniref:Flagella basal body P-ring formation protein FlgA n=1 Tax=Halanaerobacter jeridensis TaxID=706427 RepID=A0A938XU89_9FIRM|nr:flagellar basal body P-ring formation chaperone FlgA [Halanaerobacter jeridensis]MBM7556999.1 flagella basal body P-ring formation protein FlgA [Halanaerobacter jeridensis]
MKARLVVLVLLLLLIMSTTTILAQENSIIIPSQVQVPTLNIKLNSIAEIKGSSAFKEQVKDLSLGQTPYPGYQRVIYRDDVIYALRQENINVGQINLRIPYQFTVRADYNPLAIDKLSEYGRQYIKSNLKYDEEKIEIETLNPPEELLVPQGKINFKVVKNYNRRLLGVNMLPIKVLVDGQLYRKFYIKFSTKLRVQVLIPKKRLEQGQSLTADLFVQRERLLTNAPDRYVSSFQALENKVLTRTLAAEQILTNDMLATPQLVTRWQKVKIVAKVGGVVVTTTGKALENGRKGDIIKVKNTNSNQTIEAKVVAPNEVEVVIN